MLSIKPSIISPSNLLLIIQFPISLKEVDDVTLFIATMEPPVIEIEMDLRKEENIELKINTLCGMEKVGESLKNSLLSCIHTLMQEYDRNKSNIRLPLEPLKLSNNFDIDRDIVKKVDNYWNDTYINKWSYASLNSLQNKPIDTNIFSFSTAISGKYDNFSMPFKPIIDENSKLITLQMLLATPTKLAEIFSLIVLHHPKHLQHLRVLHNVEKKFAKALDNQYNAIEAKLNELRTRQNMEVEAASSNVALFEESDFNKHSNMDSLSNGDAHMERISKLVFLHETQKQDMEAKYQREINLLKSKQRRNYIEFLFNFYQQQILPSMLTVPRSTYARLQSAHPPWQHPRKKSITSIPNLNNLSLTTQSSCASAHSVAISAHSLAKFSARASLPYIKPIEDEKVVEPVKTFCSPKLTEVLSTEIWLGNQSKTKFRISLLIGDLIDLIGCDFGETAAVGTNPAVLNDNSLIISRSSMLHSLYSDHSLSAAVIPHDSNSLLEIAPFPVDCTSPSEFKEKQSRITAREKLVSQSIDRYTDFHFPTVSEQFYNLVNSLQLKTISNSNSFNNADKISQSLQANSTLKSASTPKESPKSVSHRDLKLEDSTLVKHVVTKKSKIDSMFADIPAVTFDYHPSTPSVLDPLQESQYISRQIVEWIVYSALQKCSENFEVPTTKASLFGNIPPTIIEETSIVSPFMSPKKTKPVPPPVDLPKRDYWEMNGGDFVITKHSNLRDVHLLFHLMGVKDSTSIPTKDSSSTESQTTSIDGLKQIITSADQTGVSSLSLPVLLSGTYKATKHPPPMAIQKELDQIFRIIRAALHTISNRRSNKNISRFASLCELKLVIPLTSSSIPIMESSLVKHAIYAFGESFIS